MCLSYPIPDYNSPSNDVLVEVNMNFNLIKSLYVAGRKHVPVSQYNKFEQAILECGSSFDGCFTVYPLEICPNMEECRKLQENMAEHTQASGSLDKYIDIPSGGTNYDTSYLESILRRDKGVTCATL